MKGKEEEVNRKVGGLKITLCNNTTSPLPGRYLPKVCAVDYVSHMDGSGNASDAKHNPSVSDF